MSRLALLMPYLLWALSVSGESLTYNTILTVDFPVSNKYNKFSQIPYCQTNIDTTVDMRIDCFYQISEINRLHLYDLTFENIKIPKGTGYKDLAFSKALCTKRMHPDYFEVIRRFKMVPAGQYKTTVSFLPSKYIKCRTNPSRYGQRSGIRIANSMRPQYHWNCMQVIWE